MATEEISNPEDVEGSGQECNTTFSDEQKRKILFVTAFTGLGSMSCCIAAVSMVLGLRLYRLFAYRLATYQVLGSLFWSLTCGLVLLQLDYDPNSAFSRGGCYLVAFLITYSMWVKLLFTLWLTFHLFCYVVFLRNLKKLEWFYIASSVLFPLICVAWVPFIDNNYGVAGAWCAIRVWKGDCATQKYQEGLTEVFALFYGPIVVSLALNTLAVAIMMVVLVQRVYRYSRPEREPLLAEQSDANRRVLKQLLPLLSYPIIYFTLMLFSVTNRLYDAFGNSTGFELIVTGGATSASMGFFAGLALIVHISCLNFVKKSSSSKGTKLTDNLASKTPSSTYANLSTTKTRFSLQRESVVDENLCHSTGVD